jgi:hypothetical protein
MVNLLYPFSFFVIGRNNINPYRMIGTATILLIKRNFIQATIAECVSVNHDKFPAWLMPHAWQKLIVNGIILKAQLVMPAFNLMVVARPIPSPFNNTSPTTK